MAYTDKEQLTNFIGEHLLRQASDKSNIGVTDEDSLQLAIDKAQGVIDGYIGAVVTLPLSSTPKVLKSYADILALYFLYYPRPPAIITESYNSALEELEKIRTGQKGLGVDENGTPYVTNPTTVIASDPQVLTLYRMESYLDNPNSYTYPRGYGGLGNWRY